MDDLNEKIAGILNDPESMKRVRQMAESLLGQGEQPPPAPRPDDISSLLSGEGMPDANQIKILLGIANRLKNSGNDNRTALLKALKPHLSEPRREKVDTAIKLLKLLEILPFLKESGILSL